MLPPHDITRASSSRSYDGIDCVLGCGHVEWSTCIAGAPMCLRRGHRGHIGEEKAQEVWLALDTPQCGYFLVTL